ncbi:conserved hypothetical protein [Sporisorium reilianum SRZ2]|uniref:DnaJ homologue subfamily C member 28 conserved domain-containing protein n=1 Tax=Sporisorium reilianum (strain SRZ2) TaxID=999809 RepID=E6ZPC5_SPORE|nr:conserved hypothetical protein [Sporisorium reilianum SRZ2]
MAASSSRVRLIAATTSNALTRHAAQAPRSARLFSICTSCLDSASRGEASTSSSSSEGLTGSDKLLQDALRLEAEEEAALSKQSRSQDPNDPMWTGEERVQDTVLRMVMDKYKPLRIRVGDEHKDPADSKIKAGIQVPSTPGSVAADGAGSQFFVPPGVEGAHEDGRKLPKTPDAKPWRAVYVRPAHLSAAADDFVPSIYYGQFLASSSSDARAKLKAAGINTVPTHDPKALTQLRHGLKSAERRTKLLRARDSVLDYQHSDAIRGDEVSDTTRNLQLQLGHAQGWDSVIEKRIKSALDSAAFRENKLRGKPIVRDMQEKNPFLAREEYFMNRIVRRQGAAPPWVELNMELESELKAWRGRVDEAWVRRASRMITTSPALGEGLEPLPTPTAPPSDPSAPSGGPAPSQPLHLPTARTPGEARLLDVATRYRDAEWQTREHAYHTHELHRLNDLIRKHNHLAPFTAHKGLMVLDVELAAMWARTLPTLVAEVSDILRAKADGREGRRKDGWDAAVDREGIVRYDVWGREVRVGRGAGEGDVRKGWLDGWLGSGVSAGERGGGGEGGNSGGVEQGREAEIQSWGLLAAIQKSLHWARRRFVGA